MQDMRVARNGHSNANIPLDQTKVNSFNGEVRQREKVTRTLKHIDSPILSGYRIYHNYIRAHKALDHKTPAEVAGIKIVGQDKWLTIIQNASQK